MEDKKPNGSPSLHAGIQSPLALVLAWLIVGLPLLWGVVQTLEKAWALFS